MNNRDFWPRVPQLLVGLLGVGLGVSVMIDAHVGLAPWDVLHQGIHRHTHVAIGTISIVVGLLLFVFWIPLKQKIGVGTVLNVFVIGFAIDGFLLVPFHPHSDVVKYTACIVGNVILSAGAGFYIGAGLGTGPRDGLMTGMVERGYPLRTVRTVLELIVLASGWLLGGNIGFGTVLFAFTVGPILHYVLHHTDRGVLTPRNGDVEPSLPN